MFVAVRRFSRGPRSRRTTRNPPRPPSLLVSPYSSVSRPGVFARRCTLTTGGSSGSRCCTDPFLHRRASVNSDPPSFNFTLKVVPAATNTQCQQQIVCWHFPNCKHLALKEKQNTRQMTCRRPKEVGWKMFITSTLEFFFSCSSKCSYVYNTQILFFITQLSSYWKILLLCASSNECLNHVQSYKASSISSVILVEAHTVPLALFIYGNSISFKFFLRSCF